MNCSMKTANLSKRSSNKEMNVGGNQLKPIRKFSRQGYLVSGRQHAGSKRKAAFVVILLSLVLLLPACSVLSRNDGSVIGTSIQGTTVPETTTNRETTDGPETTASRETTTGRGPTNGYHQTEPGPAETSETGGMEAEADIRRQIAGMSLDEKIGQLFIVGFDGYKTDEKVRSMIQNNHVGGIILFRGNIKNAGQLLDMTNTLKSANSENRVPLFISVDEEGGRISRLPAELHKLPSNQSIGEVGSTAFSYEIGGILSEELRTFGFNLDFAPVLDIHSNPRNTVIGDRSFGNNAEIVTKLGIQTLKGIRDGGIIPVVKHFPGHGDTEVDSHVGLPSVSHELDRLKSLELVPFQEAVSQQADAVMVAHILLDRVDSENPASMSKRIITGLLRDEMGFDGVVMTDDMTMGAILQNYDIGEAAVKAILAGSDVILVCHGYDRQSAAIEAVRSAVGSGLIPADRIDGSVYRILKLKNKYGLTDAVDSTKQINMEKLNRRIDTAINRYMPR